ncbi:MAG: hypothetical protein QXF35_00510 [Candidatus Bilamarchaeaceae archaeon]
MKKYTNLFAVLEQVHCDFKEEYENLELFVYSVIAFAIPFIFSHPQILTGTIVNAFLILAAFRLRGLKVMPLVFLPSIAAFLNSILFGPFTFYLIYLMPFIWIGNFILIYVFKELYFIRKINYWITASAAAILKSVLIFSGAYIFSTFGIVPVILLSAMGVVQLLTAILGAILSFLILSLYRLKL